MANWQRYKGVIANYTQSKLLFDDKAEEGVIVAVENELYNLKKSHQASRT